MGFFRGKKSSPPPVQMTAFTPATAAPTNPPVNFMQLFDSISGKNFTFVNGTNGQRYLQLRNEAAEAERDYNRVQQEAARPRGGFLGMFQEGWDRAAEERRARLQSLREQMQQEAGTMSVSVNRDPSRLALDAQINAIDTHIPANMAYAAELANLTGRMRDLSTTIETMERTDPFLIEQNQGLINSFRQAQKQALDKGFDIRQNGLDTKLINMGIMNSSNALGAQIALARERVEAEVNTELQTHQLAQGAKQNSIENYFKLGNQLVQNAGVTIGQSQLEQDRLTNQGRLQLEQAQLATNAQLADMNHSLAYSQTAQNFINPAADRAVSAIGQDNSSMLGLQRNQLGQSQLNTERWQAQQANRSDPWRTLGMGLVGGLAGTLAGPVGAAGATFIGNALSSTNSGRR